MSDNVNKSIFSGMGETPPAKKSIFSGMQENTPIDSESTQKSSIFDNVQIQNREEKKPVEIVEKLSVFASYEAPKPKSPRVFETKSFIPEDLSSGLFDEKEMKIIVELRFGGDDIEKFVKYASNAIETYSQLMSDITILLAREEFSKSRQLLSRLVHLIEDSSKEHGFSFFKAKKNTSDIQMEFDDIISSLKKYEKLVTEARSEIKHTLDSFESLTRVFTRYKKIAVYLLDNGNYENLSDTNQFKAVLLSKIAMIEEYMSRLQSAKELNSLKAYLINFSLVVEDILLQNHSFILEVITGEITHNITEKENIVQKLKGFLQ